MGWTILLLILAGIAAYIFIGGVWVWLLRTFNADQVIPEEEDWVRWLAQNVLSPKPIAGLLWFIGVSCLVYGFLVFGLLSCYKGAVWVLNGFRS